MLNGTDWPGVNVRGVLKPEILKPEPAAVAWVIIVFELPVLLIFPDWV